MTTTTPAPPGDPVVAELNQMVAQLGAWARHGVDPGGTDAGDPVRVDRIAALERAKAAAAACQAAETVHFARAQVAAQHELGTHPREIGRGIAEQLAMAVKVGPWHGARRLTLARALWFDLPATFDLLCAGQISEYVAQLVVTETSHLDPATRHLVDAQAVAAGLDTMSPREAERCARRLAYAADPAGSLRRGRTARSERRVTLRPAPDTMAHLNAFVPVEQGVACWAALIRHADTLRAGGDPRTRDQLLTDTLVERVTGQTTAAAVPVEVELIVPLETLLDPDPDPGRDADVGRDAEVGHDPTPDPDHGPRRSDDPPPGRHTRPADLLGYGPLPEGIVADLLRTGAAHTWRRLFTVTRTGRTTVGAGSEPTTDSVNDANAGLNADTDTDTDTVIVGGDPRTRYFTGWLKTLIRLRDQHCRHPYCTAPIRHIDHMRRWTDCGLTTLSNGQGLCERHNHTKDLPGWHSRTDGGPDSAPHVGITTPTGHHYRSRAPNPP